MAAAAGEAAEAAGTWADEGPAIPAGRRAAHCSAPAPRDPREIRALRPFARPASRCHCRCRTDAGDHERDLGETRAPGRTRVPGTVAGGPGTRSARASLPRAGLPQAGLPQASLPQAGLRQAGLPRARLLRTGDMPPKAPAVPTRAVPAPVAPRPVARGPTAGAGSALAHPSRGILGQGAGARDREVTASGAVAAGSASRWQSPAPSLPPHLAGPSCAAGNVR
jgi:hypothetical protein